MKQRLKKGDRVTVDHPLRGVHYGTVKRVTEGRVYIRLGDDTYTYRIGDERIRKPDQQEEQ
jgi:preprotein translocase subunit YajC